jgi:hypothetical protein
MNNDDIHDDDLDEDADDLDWTIESAPRSRTRVRAPRRRIEDLQELRRIRKLLDDDEFTLDLN